MTTGFDAIAVEGDRKRENRVPLPKSIVVLTGAGISAESGLGTFRDTDGIWTRYPLEDLATPEGFARNPDFVHGFYNDRRAQLATARPHAGHIALATLEDACRAEGADFLLVTQNVDNLHEQAGSKTIIHMHGELTRVRCTNCGTVATTRRAIGRDTVCTACKRSGHMRPHIVWFGEMPFEMDRISRALRHCRLFLSIGTSGAVYPAAGFVQEARYNGAKAVELSLEPSENADVFDEAVYGPASEILPPYVGQLIQDPASGPT
ncbi:MAG: NAD-dependent deacylase [Pseudomonadota bacterium]